MPAIFDILKDKKFQALNYDDKKAVLSHFDSKFEALPPEDKDQVMKHFNLNQPEVPPEDLHPVAKAASEIYTPALVTLGGVMGGTAGAAGGVPTGPGAAVTAAAGSALGMAGGEAAAAGIDRMTGLKPPIANPTEAVKETGQNLEHGAMYEAAGRGIGEAAGKALKFVTGPIADKIDATGQAILAKAKDMGIDLSPAEVLRSKSVSFLENVLDNLPFTAGVANKFRLSQAEQMIKQRNNLIQNHGSTDTIEQLGEKIQEQVDNVVRAHTKVNSDAAMALKDRLLRKLGSNQTYEEVGMAGQEALKAASMKRYDEAGQLYDSIDEYFSPNTKHFPETYQKKAVELLSQQERASASLQDPETLAVLRDISKRDLINNRMMQLREQGVPENTLKMILETEMPKDQLLGRTWQEMTADRSRLGKLIAENDPSYGFSGGAKGTKMVSSEAAGVYKQLFKALDEDMGKVAEQAGPEAQQALELARSYYGESKQLFNNPTVLRMAKADPEKLIDMVFKPGAVTPIRMARKAMGSDAFDGLSRRFTNKLLETSENVPLTSELLDSRIKKYGVDTIEEIYGHNAPDIINLPKQLSTVEPELANNQFFKNVLKRDPSKVVDYLVRPDNTVNAKKLIGGLGDKAKQSVGEGLTTKILQDLADTSHGDFSANKYDSALNKYGDETLKAWLPKETIQDLKDFASVTMNMQKASSMGNNPSGTGRVLMTGGFGAYALRNPIKAISIAIPANVLARLYFSPIGRKYLTEGVATSLRSPQAQQIFNKLSTAALALIHEESKDDQ